MRSLIPLLLAFLAHFRTFFYLLLGVSLLGFLPWMMNNHGRDSAIAVDAFVANTFPSTTPGVGSGNWIATDAFPNLTFNNPIHFEDEPGTNRLLIGEHRGKIVAINKNSSASSKQTYLDIISQTYLNGESGLMSFALHPRYDIDSNYVYVFYKTQISGLLYSRVSRFTVSSGSANVASERVLIQQHTQADNHNGGALFFGDDGFLYISMGDEGGGNNTYGNAQSLNKRLFGGILRIDVDQDPTKGHAILRQPNTISGADKTITDHYFIPDDNPFQDPTGGTLEEFYALGLRNPHRVTYDSPTGQIWAGDVGQAKREEINRIIKGANYQWAYKEGTKSGPKNTPSTIIGIDTPPLYEYGHGSGISVIGGYVYRGSTHPELIGKYLFADYGSKRLWALEDSSGTILVNQLMTLSFPICAFGRDEDDKQYMLEYGNPGKIYLLDRQNPGAPEPPALLSQTGVFQSLTPLVPEDFMLPYGLNMPFWSDNSIKTRWMIIPNNGSHNTGSEQIKYKENGDWLFPEGTVMVKHFELPVDETNSSVKRHLETRFIIHGTGGEYYGITYRWRDDQTEADLLLDSRTDTLTIATASGPKTINWYYPGRGECMSCHNDPATVNLGPNTRQFNKDYFYPLTGRVANQLTSLTHLNIFDNSPDTSQLGLDALLTAVSMDDPTASLEDKALSYLDANCAGCHRPGNAMQADFDSRMTTPLVDQGLIYADPYNALGIAGDKLIIPGQPEHSILYKRLNSVHTSIAMPLLGKNHIDTIGTQLIYDWISAMPVETGYSGGLLGQRIDFDSLPNMYMTDAPFSLAATTTSGLAISYQVLSGPASLSGNLLTLGGQAGYVLIEATQSGNGSYAPAPEVRQGFWVFPAGKGTGTGLEASYYSDPTLTNLVTTQTDPIIDFYWGDLAAIPGGATDGFSIAWQGEIEAPYSETFTFTTSTDDGVRLWVNSVLLIDQWGDQGLTGFSATIDLNAWQRVPIRMEFYENESYAAAQLKWSSPSLVEEVVPQSFLYPDASFSFPVEWLDFTATPEIDHVVLEWTTANEQNTAKFLVERSADGSLFSPIGEVAAAGNSSSNRDYTSQDRDPFTGINYYRLKQLDQNSDYSYSEVLEVHFQQQARMTVFPNPLQPGSPMHIDISMAEEQEGWIELHSIAGQRLYSHLIPAGLTRSQLRIETSDLPGGLYILSLRQGQDLISTKRVLLISE